MTRASIIIPAYNEAKSIIGVLAPALAAKRAGIVQDVIVVDDGSKDATAEIAERAGAEVIRLAENVGKGGAFLAGLKCCREKGTTELLTLDADLHNLTPRHIQELLDKLVEPARMGDGKMRAPDMAVCKYYEEEAAGGFPHYDAAYPATFYSGVRAFRMRALDFLSNENLKASQRFREAGKGFGLEEALNHWLKDHYRIYEPFSPLKAREPFGGAARVRQYRDLMHTRGIVEIRADVATATRKKQGLLQAARAFRKARGPFRKALPGPRP